MPSKIPLLLASGRPIIASVPKLGTAASSIKKSGGGIVVAPESPNALAHAVMDLYKNPAKAAALGARGRKFAVDKYSFDSAIAQYEVLFSDAVASKADELEVLPLTTTDI
jgi:colanic acid biosynthesis glycosyl transferase WcaI